MEKTILTFQAAVVCSMLGYPVTLSAPQNSLFGLVPVDFAYDNVVCTGNEIYLDLCPHLNVDDCGANEGAGVICDFIRF